MMRRHIYFPFIMLWAFLFSMFFASIELSDYYSALDFIPCFIILILLAVLILIQKMLPMKKVATLLNVASNNVLFYRQLAAVTIFFIIELGIYGVPLLGMSREDFTGIKVLHVAFYGFIFYLNVKAVSIRNIRVSSVTFIVSSVMGMLMMTRQLIMYSFLAFLISLLFVGKITTKRVVFCVVFLLMPMFFLFGFLGDMREGNVENLIYAVGGANDLGRQIPSGLYWIWLYIATPIYNLMDNLGDSIFTLRFENYEAFFGQIFVPQFLATRFDLVAEKPNLVIDVLNVASGYGLSAKYAGLLGIIIHTLAIILFYLIGKRIVFGIYKKAFDVHFSICSMLFIFSNTFTRAEYFIVFIYIFLFSALSRITITHFIPMQKKRGSCFANIKHYENTNFR